MRVGNRLYLTYLALFTFSRNRSRVPAERRDPVTPIRLPTVSRATANAARINMDMRRWRPKYTPPQSTVRLMHRRVYAPRKSPRFRDRDARTLASRVVGPAQIRRPRAASSARSLSAFSCGVSGPSPRSALLSPVAYNAALGWCAVCGECRLQCSVRHRAAAVRHRAAAVRHRAAVAVQCGIGQRCSV